MTAPLNGVLLNGGAPYATWAWGYSRAEATATAEPVVNSIHRYVGGELFAESVSSAIPDRLAFLNGEEQPYADMAVAATRYAYVSASALVTAEAPIEPVRTAWFEAPTISADAQTSAYSERWRLFFAQSEAWAETSDADYRVYRRSFSRLTPAQARTWAAESHIRRTRVNQVYAASTAIARSRLRVLANTALGFGRSETDAATVADNLRVNTYHSARAQSLVGCELHVDTSRIRIIIGGMLSEAVAKAAPTITTATGRYSYNSGVGEAASDSVATSKVIRVFYSTTLVAESGTAVDSTFLVRGVKGSSAGEGESYALSGSFTRHIASGKAPSVAATTSAFNRYRWSPMVPAPAFAEAWLYGDNSVAAYNNEVVAVALASAFADGYVERGVTAPDALASATSAGIGVRAAGVVGEASGVAVTSGAPLRTAYMGAASASAAQTTGVGARHAYTSSDVHSWAEVIGSADRTAWATAPSLEGYATAAGDNSRVTFAENLGDTAVSTVSISANIYTLRYWGEQTVEASAEGVGTTLRITPALPVSDHANAVTMRFVFRINIDGDAPTRRTVQVPYTDRHLALAGSSREYRVA